MHTVYTTTITTEARRRGIRVEVIDPELPLFVLRHGRRAVRCFNALTDRVGAATFHLAQNKHSANRFLRQHGFPVPAQELYRNRSQADRFLARHRSVVVKPCTQWGGRGVAVAVKTPAELRRAVRRALRFEEAVVLEQCVPGVDQRLIVVDGRFVAAIRRNPAAVVGNGRDTVRALILRRNRAARAVDPSNRIPLDAETERNLAAGGWRYGSVPPAGKRVRVRLTANYHTGGTVEIVTRSVSRALVEVARRIARLVGAPVIGIDFLVEPRTGRYRVIELSPDLAISPPEGEEVAQRFLDCLFPETARKRRPGVAAAPVRPGTAASRSFGR
jgi:D-alanine-D-alanine ligase-like ATP-grasp enzyme